MSFKEQIQDNGLLAAYLAGVTAIVAGFFRVILKKTSAPKDVLEGRRDSLEAAFRIIGRLEADVIRLTQTTLQQTETIAGQQQEINAQQHEITALQGELKSMQLLHDTCEGRLNSLQQMLLRETNVTRESVERFLRAAEKIVHQNTSTLEDEDDEDEEERDK